MTTSLVWKHVSYDQVNELTSTLEPGRCKTLVASFLGLRPPPSSSSSTEGGMSEEEVLIDFHFQSFAFCKEQRFTPPKTSTVLAIFKTVLETDRRRMLIGTNNMRRSYEHFEKLLLEHAVERPPLSTGVFTEDDVRLITEYALNGYYRHFRLYEYIMKGRVYMSLEQKEVNDVERVQASRPLTEGLQLEQPESYS